MSKTILWPSADTLATLPLIAEFKPLTEWADGKPTDRQARNDAGVPLWESTALVNAGWNPTPTLVGVRFAAATKPDFAPSSALLTALTGDNAAVDNGTTADSEFWGKK